MDFQFWKDDVQSANFSVKSSNLAVDLLNSRPRPNSRTANSRPRQNLDIPGPGQILPPVVYCMGIINTEALELLLEEDFEELTLYILILIFDYNHSQ